jgi:hypothetical protein
MEKKSGKELYEGFRKMAFAFTPADLNIQNPDKVYGIIIEWAVENAVVTLTSFQSGDASMYFSSGGAFLGGIEKPDINAAAKKFVKEAEKYLTLAGRSDDLSYPQGNEVKFYFFTEDGMHIAKDSTDNKYSALVHLYVEGQNVVTQYRISQEREEQSGSNYIDDLIKYFKTAGSISEAKFGMIRDTEADKNILILAVNNSDKEKEEEIKEATLFLKLKYCRDTEMGYASNNGNKDLFEHIISNNIPLYVKGKEMLLEEKIMKQWFDPKYKQEFLDVLTAGTGSVIVLARDLKPESNTFTMQSYMHEGKEFVALFSDKGLIAKSGIDKIPENLTPVSFNWKQLNAQLQGALDKNLYRLNPATAFEVEFKINE